jgi:Flp pilus assembly protein CpaB
MAADALTSGGAPGAGALTPARALHPPRALPLRAGIGLLLALITGLAGLLFVQSSADTRTVLVAARDLPAGATLQSSDLAVSKVRLDDDLYAAAIPAAQLAGTVGKELDAPVYAHEVLVQAQLSKQPPLAPGQVAFTIPVTSATADIGRIRPRSWVAVYATSNKGQPDAKTSLVVPRAQVYDVGYDRNVTVVGGGSSAAGSGGPISSLTIVISQDQGSALAQAGQLNVALLSAEGAP